MLGLCPGKGAYTARPGASLLQPNPGAAARSASRCLSYGGRAALVALCASSADGAELANLTNSTRSPWLQHANWVRVRALGAMAAPLSSGPFGGAGGGSSGSGGGGGDPGGHGMPGSSSSPGPNTLGDMVANDAANELVEDVVLLDVGGMRCGGCVGHVKKVLEALEGVLEASVNLATETALVRVQVPAGPAGQASLALVGQQLAQALSAAGFPSRARDLRSSPSASSGPGSTASILAGKRAAKLQRLHQISWDLALAWGLSAVCGIGHLAQAWGAAAPAWLLALNSVPVHAALSAAALLGPGRDIITSGFTALAAQRPDMNSLVGLGATASFGVSCVAALLPHLGWRTFFEEPAMLLGFVLLGRALEERAKLQASADMALVPTRARLALAHGGHREVPAEAVGPGALIAVLPGDRLPVDGVVVSGRSCVDESALSGEALPLTKVPGDKVTAGTMNCDGCLTVRAEHSGQQTVIADIARTAPIQRLADSVAGRFAYGVMALSAATFLFWATAGTKLFPQVLLSAAGKVAGCGACVTAAAAAATPATTTLLSLQLACNVLVTACPCALGLATPTAVLVGTGAGARRGLLIRGGDILESLSQIDTVVFDKTGTLTAGRPQVTLVQCFDAGVGGVTQHDLLQLAAAAERSTTHPVARALTAAAASATAGTGIAFHDQQQGQAHSSMGAQQPSQRQGQGDQQGQGQELAGSFPLSPSPSAPGVMQGYRQPQLNLELQPGSFLQEPGSGVRAVVGGRLVCVGSLDWLQRQGAAVATPPTQGPTQTHPPPHHLTPHPASAPPAAQAPGDPLSPAPTPIPASPSPAQRQGDKSNAVGSSVQQQGPDAPAGAAGQEVSAGQAQGRGASTSHTRVYVSVDGRLAGCIDVQDAVRGDAPSTVAALQAQGVRCLMLSGDKAGAAQEVAAAVGIQPQDVHADTRPAGKAALVEQLRARGHRVAMVGDGINDTAALAAADVGVAMGGGVDAAGEVAQVVLLGDQLHQVADALHLSRATLAKIQQNLAWAFGYNLVSIPLAAGALLPSMGVCLTPSLSGALMGLSSLLVVSNSLLLQWELRPGSKGQGWGLGGDRVVIASAASGVAGIGTDMALGINQQSGARHWVGNDRRLLAGPGKGGEVSGRLR
ncbi:hypothetical protein QJQ45_011811 [Haematococcus lacustris]|nr:hypothetical protein QJQ45_011811 [Haematococcus lacustris]